MENIFTIPVNIQMMIVSGYAGYFISSIGKEKPETFERVISIFVYGTLGSMLFLFIDYASYGFAQKEISKYNAILELPYCIIVNLRSFQMLSLLKEL